MMEGVILQKIKRFRNLKWIKRMSTIEVFKKGESTDADMKEFERNLFRHRVKNACLGAGLLAAVMLCFAALWIAVQNQSFDTFEVVRSFDRTDTMTTQYAEFKNYVLKYSRDGISCVDSSNRALWSQTYNMQNPILHVCRNSAAVAEESGTEAMIFDETGIQGTIQTRLPIRQITVSSQGVLAVLLEDGNAMRVNLYDKAGTELVSSKFELQDVGYPVRISLSSDATKLAVSFLQVQDGGISSCLAFYNFTTVGESKEDHLVSSKIVSGIVMPEIAYMDSTHCFALGGGRLLLYEGSQIPDLKAEVVLEKEVLSVFHSEKYIGLVLEGEEEDYVLQVYDLQGHVQFEREFSLDYQTLKFSGNYILIYNESECIMMTDNGKIYYSGTFDEPVVNLYTLSGKRRYIVMHTARTDQIRLK